MSKITFDEDPSSRKVTRFLLLSQISGLGIVLALRFFQRFSLSFAVSAATLSLLIVSLLWLYARYRKLPAIREKGELNHLFLKFGKGVQKEINLIRSAGNERQQLVQAEKDEIQLSLTRLQKNHTEEGLAAASIQEAEILGVDLQLKEQLAGYGVSSAAELTEGMAPLSDLEEAQRQALLNWRDSVLEGLESTKPVRLAEMQLEKIQAKYQALQARNDALHRKAQASKQLLQHEMMSFRERLRELDRLTFRAYLGQSLASNGVVAALIALVLIGAQIVSSVSVTRAVTPAASPIPTASLPVVTPSVPAWTSSVIEAAMVGATATPTQRLPPTEITLQTSTPIVQATSARTLSPQVTLPSTVAACIPRQTSRETGLVVGIVDGDTIDVRIDDRDLRVRYIGIDTPEQDEALYAEAATYNQKLVGNKTVILVKDASETDQFNRLLRYVIVGDTFVNHELVALGYAKASAYAPDTACVSTFETAQREAQMMKLGLWMPTPEVYIPAITGGETTVICDPSYPGVCIPPAPPDLNCGEIQYRRFQVLPPDPHGFDRDHDGIGCES